MSILQTGPDGYAVPWTDHDSIIESPALDPLAGPPEDWPQCPWVDDDVWELGPALTPDEGFFEPDQVDVDWLVDLEERRAVERFYGCNARFV